MNNPALRSAFAVFHLTLGVVVFILSITTIMHSMQQYGIHALSHHAAWLAGAETIASVLFLIPGTVRPGAVALLVIFTIAIIVHGLHNELPLLVFGAGTVLVMVHGGWSKQG